MQPILWRVVMRWESLVLQPHSLGWSAGNVLCRCVKRWREYDEVRSIPIAPTLAPQQYHTLRPHAYIVQRFNCVKTQWSQLSLVRFTERYQGQLFDGFWTVEQTRYSFCSICYSDTCVAIKIPHCSESSHTLSASCFIICSACWLNSSSQNNTHSWL